MTARRKTDAEIQRLLNAGKSPRTIRLETYHKYWDCTIYEGRPGYMDQTIDVPLLERAPIIQYPIVRAATQAIVSMALGLGKFPEILSMTSEDDSTFDERFGLSIDDSVILDAAVKKIIDQTRLQTVAMQLAEHALVTGTAIPFVSIVDGKLRVSQLDPKTAIPTFNPKRPEQLDKIEVCYRYVEDFWSDEEKAWLKRVMVYRRVIDQQDDITYKPVEVINEKDFPKPSTPDKDKTYHHGFGFCPAIWYAHKATECDSRDIDGRPIHWGLCGQLDALQFAYSQRHRAALYAGDPQYWETGVDDQDIQPMGRVAFAPQPTANNPKGLPMQNGWAFGSGQSGRPARKKGPGAVWQYQNPDTKVGMLTLPGDALKGIDQHAADLRIKLCEALGITFVDPSQLKGAGDISGKTLAFIFAHQVATCNALREDFGRKCLLPILNLIYRVILATTKNAKGALYLPGIEELTKVLQRFDAPVGDEASFQWFEPAQKLVWGAYFEASDVDEATKTATAMQTWIAGGITLKTAVQHIQDVFAIQNVDQYVAELMKENEEKRRQEVEQAGAIASASGKLSPTGKAGAGPFAKIDEPSAQSEAASANPVPKRQSPETRAWRKPSKTD